MMCDKLPLLDVQFRMDPSHQTMKKIVELITQILYDNDEGIKQKLKQCYKLK